MHVVVEWLLLAYDTEPRPLVRSRATMTCSHVVVDRQPLIYDVELWPLVCALSGNSSWTLSSSSGRSRTTFFLRPLVHSFCGNNLCARCRRATAELQQLMCARRRRAIDTHSRHRSTATRVRLKWQQLVNGTIERRSLVQYIFLRPLVQQLMHAVNERRSSGNSLCSRCR